MVAGVVASVSGIVAGTAVVSSVTRAVVHTADAALTDLMKKLDPDRYG